MIKQSIQSAFNEYLCARYYDTTVNRPTASPSVISLWAVSVNLGPEANDPPSDMPSGPQQPNTASQSVPTHSTSSHHVGVLSSHVISGRGSTVQDVLRERERPRSQDVYYSILF